MTNDGRANLAADPLNGRPLPTLAEALDTFCHVNNRPGCLVRDALEVTGPPDMMKLQQSWQTSIGRQRHGI